MALSRKIFALLECKICLDQFERPKLLSCGHTYCKNCLDEILIFKEDGSAEILCPLKCKSNVRIGRGETTICLPTNYSLSDIVDQTEADREPCQTKPKQSNIIVKQFVYSKYCKAVLQVRLHACVQDARHVISLKFVSTQHSARRKLLSPVQSVE
ncbi:tripartite motif-containing protein 59-like [Hydractinia symbiolongicarpus]|uniref:tripartite motif-containing protein 59-like n=1 Tax=Hydractinia symbiolongicarpus TaxID=13093 RepID=UPI00254A908A|nr:tripartite motif-containing protein 59-like [Hydractinia symbiolongicarpus]